MPKKQKYDLIVVGAGPGGTACAKIGADLGLDVLLIERAEVPGQKNMSGSVLFKDITESIFPGFNDAEMHKGSPTLGNLAIKWAQDNDEHEIIVGLGPGSDTMSLQQCVDRSVSDEWLAAEAVKAGAEPLYATRVDDLIWDFSKGYENRRIIGVITDKGEKIYADAVADCSGMHSELARKSGLIPNHSMKKVQFAAKVIYQWTPDMDEDVKRRCGYWKARDGRDCCDWMKLAVYFGARPDYFAAHAQPVFPDRIIELTVYECMQESFDADFNIWQRIEWYKDAMRDYLEGMKPIHVNFHSLNAFDLVGFDGSDIQLPGLFLVGDAASYSNPLESWGANVSQWMGREAAKLVAEMKKDKDFSAERFAAYRPICENAWVGQDALNLAKMTQMFRDGRFVKLWDGVDALAVSAIADKFTNHSYAELLPKAIGKAAPHFAGLLNTGVATPFYLAGENGAKKLGALMGILQKIKG